jgi:molecular chaperone GrpE (heat shock protein)
MLDEKRLKLSKWPFFLGDLLLLGAAGFVYAQSTLPLGLWQMVIAGSCVLAGACLGVLPFVLEYRILLKLVETSALTTAVAQIQNLESIAAQISNATGRWQNAQEEAEKVAAAAKAISDRMAMELKAFTEFMQRASEGERATLRLEVEKLRRSESDWLQVSVRMLDHVHALHQGAVRSGQPNLIEQLTAFQNACRDAARRVGLTPYAADPAEPFDPQRHQLLDGQSAPANGATVAETVATGYTFQGRLLRPALVRLAETGPVEASEEPTGPPSEQEQQSQLPFAAAPPGAGS